MGVELLKSSGEGNESILKALWHHSDAIMCCSMKVIYSYICINLCLMHQVSANICCIKQFRWKLLLVHLCIHLLCMISSIIQAANFYRRCPFSPLRTRLVLTCWRQPWLHFRTSLWRRYSMIMEGKTSAPRSLRLCIRSVILTHSILAALHFDHITIESFSININLQNMSWNYWPRWY